MSPKYASRDGFDKIFEWDVRGTSALVKDIDSKNLAIGKNMQILDFKEVDFEKFMEFDRKITSGLERGDYIKEFFSMQGSYNKVKEFC